MRVRIPPAILVAILLCAAPARGAETGVNETVAQTVSTVDKAPALGADWVRLWVLWSDHEQAPGRYTEHLIAQLDHKVAALQARGVRTLVVVHHSPAWQGGGLAPPDPVRFAQFIGTLAQRVPGVAAWELWNEPDSPAFWAGAPRPDAYAALLRTAYAAIKSSQPQDVVVTGGMVGNDLDFLQQLYAHGAGGAFDAVGIHTDTACLTTGPGGFYRDEAGRIGRYSFSAYRELRQAMLDHGDGAKPIWLTELGWNSQRGSCPVGRWAGRKPVGVSRARQARLLRAAYGCLAADPYVQVAFWFGLQDIPARFTPHARGYGLYGPRGRAKPAARAFGRLDRGVRARRCGANVDRVAPTIVVRSPRDGQRFRDKLTVRVRAYDNPGGAGLGRVMLALDGRHIRSWGDGGGALAPWWGSADWSPGPHTLTFRVRDAAHNEATVSLRVEKR